MSLTHQAPCDCQLSCHHVLAARPYRRKRAALSAGILSQLQAGRTKDKAFSSGCLVSLVFVFLFRKESFSKHFWQHLIGQNWSPRPPWIAGETENSNTYSPYRKNHQERNWLKWVWSDLILSTLISSTEGDLGDFGCIYVCVCLR